MIIAARRAPAAAGGPDPLRISAVDLQRHTLPGWMAWHEPLGEWTLRAAGGFTGRANSCHAVGDPGVPIQQAAERIITFAAAHLITPMAQVIEGSPEEQALRDLGWIERSTSLQWSSSLAWPNSCVIGLVIPLCRSSKRSKPEWEQAYQQSRPNSADPDVVRMILNGNPPRAFATVAGERADDHPEPVAIARGHRSESWLGLASIWTIADHRRPRAGHRDDGRTRPLGSSPGRAIRLRSSGDCQRAGHNRLRQARLRSTPPLPLPRSYALRRAARPARRAVRRRLLSRSSVSCRRLGSSVRSARRSSHGVRPRRSGRTAAGSGRRSPAPDSSAYSRGRHR